MKPTPFFAVVETYDGGVNVIPYHKKESAIKRFQVILMEVFFNPNWTRSKMDKELEKATKAEYYSVGEWDVEQKQTVQIQTITFED